MEVFGCTSEQTAKTIRGGYAQTGENHGRPVFRRGNLDVFAYFWDERDGESFCGWWFGPQVGGDQVWAYHPERALQPPSTGWHVPYGGPIDQTLIVRLKVAATGQQVPRQVPVRPPAQSQQPRPQQQQQQQQLRPAQPPQQQQVPQQQQQQRQQQLQQMQQQRQQQQQRAAEEKAKAEAERQRAREEMLKKQREAAMAKQKVEDQRRRQLAALGATRAAIQKVRLATPENFDDLKREVDELLTAELAKLSPEAANLLFEEAEKHLDFARKRVEQLQAAKEAKEQRAQEVERRRQAVAEDAADPTAPPKVEVPAGAVGAIIGKSGSMLKRIISMAGCNIEVPQRGWTAPDGTVAIKLQGVAKQRRLAAEAIHLVVDGADESDLATRASGTIVVPHRLKHPGREEWLTWRLKAVEFKFGLPATVTKTAVHFPLKETLSVFSDELSGERAAVRSAAEEAVAQAQGLGEESVDAKADADPSDARIAEALGPFAQHYGVLARTLPAEDGVVKCLILGPPDAARDAAALLWSRFVQGRSVAAILQPPGRVQTMTDTMAKQFDTDLRELEEECEVQVTQSDTSLWLAGRSDEIVAQARWTVYEMLQFYLPEEFLLLEGLQAAGLEKLTKDPELRALALKAPTAAVAIHVAEGAAWICGPPAGRAPLERRVRALAHPSGEKSMDQPPVGGKAAKP